jgi:serine/threonine protein kinase
MSVDGRKAETRTTDPVGTPPVKRATSAPDPLADTRLAGPDERDAFDTDRIAPSLPTALFERYKIKRRLGAGGMGVVYEAMDLNLHRVVALKVVKLTDEDPAQLAEAANRLVREARAMAVLSHKNVVAVYDVGMHGVQVYVAMQLVDGVTLRQWLGGGARSKSEILRVLCEAGAGLAAAHRARLVHRDFKPDNVLVSRRGSVRVTDFGLARRANFATEEDPVQERTSRPKVLDVHSVESVTRSGAILGTPAYMPPEQSEGLPCDARADQFSFCVTAWEALYGTRPFSGTNWSQLYSNLLSGNINEPELKKRVARPIHKALRRGLLVDPAERFATMDELLDILSTGIKKPRKWLYYVIVPTVSAAAAGLVTAIALKNDDRPPAPSPSIAPPTVATTPPSPTVSSEPIKSASPAVSPAVPAQPVEGAPTRSDPKQPKRKTITKETPSSATTATPATQSAPPEPPKVDPLADVRTKRRAVDTKAKQKGLLGADLPRPASSAIDDADAAIAAGDASKAAAAIAEAERAIEAVVIDHAFINAKLARLNRQLEQSKGREEEFRALYTQLKTLVTARKYADANTLLNDMAARLAKK